jgi:hypothetical protein
MLVKLLAIAPCPRVLAFCFFATIITNAAFAQSQPPGPQLPNTWNEASLQQAKGNLVRWRDSERRRLGEPFAPPPETLNDRQACEVMRARGQTCPPRPEPRGLIAPVSGYFVVMEANNSAALKKGSVLQGDWQDPFSQVGQTSEVYATAQNQQPRCGVPETRRLSVRISDLAFVGPDLPNTVAEIADGLRRQDPTQEINLPLGLIGFARSLTENDVMNARVGDDGWAAFRCRVGTDGRPECQGQTESHRDFHLRLDRILRSLRFKTVDASGQSTIGVCTTLKITVFNQGSGVRISGGQ